MATAGSAGGLSREAIVARAVSIVDSQGSGALSLRALARDLGVTPMALYWHVRDKDELFDAVLDATMATIRIREPGGDPLDELSELGRRYRAAFAAHPTVVPLLTRATAPGPSATRLMTHSLGLLRDAGFDPDGAMNAYLLLAQFLMGSVVMEHIAAAPTGSAGQAFPTADARFDFGLRCLVEGLRSLVADGRLGSQT